MTSEDYKKLNYYLNLSFNMLEYEDNFLLQNSDLIDYNSSELAYELKDLSIDKKVVKNHLTFNDVFLLARKIIAKINKNYLKDYDNLIDSGQLDFSYNEKYIDSHFVYLDNLKIGLINMNREFNYHDVILLVHEFFHYTNYQTNLKNDNLYLLTEFISIYFEIFSTNSLIKDEIKFEELDAHFRINNLADHIRIYQKYSPVITSFTNFGNIDNLSIDLMREYFYDITPESFEEICRSLLKRFEIVETKYRMEIKYEKNFDDFEFASRISEIFKDNYRYIFGTMLAFYATYHCDINGIINLNDNINSVEFRKMNVFEILDTIGINLNDESFIQDTAQAIKCFVKKSKKR